MLLSKYYGQKFVTTKKLGSRRRPRSPSKKDIIELCEVLFSKKDVQHTFKSKSFVTSKKLGKLEWKRELLPRPGRYVGLIIMIMIMTVVIMMIFVMIIMTVMIMMIFVIIIMTVMINDY